MVLLWVIFAAVYYLALRRGANCGETALVTMAGVAVGCYSFGPRMLHFGWLCLVLLLMALERFEASGKSLWLLPPLFALWINLHGSWPFGFVVLGVYVVSGLAYGRWTNVVAEPWTRGQLTKLVAATFVSMVALLANPYGYKLLWYPFELLHRQEAVRDNIIEWQSVDFHTAWGKLAMLMIFALLAAAWFSPNPWKLRDILLVLFALVTSLSHLRFLLFAAIILIPILAPRLRLFASYDIDKNKPWLNLAMIVVIAGMIMWIYPGAAPLQNNIDSQFPRDALQFMKQRHITGRLFHYYDFGGYIEFYAPEIRTFADGRADIFIYNGIFDDYLKINKIDAPFELLDKYKINYVLFPVDKHLSYVLDHSTVWRTIYHDDVVNLYERTTAAQAQGHWPARSASQICVVNVSCATTLLNSLLTSAPTTGRIATAEIEIKIASSAYSTRSRPDSARCKFFRIHDHLTNLLVRCQSSFHFDTWVSGKKDEDHVVDSWIT